MKTNPDATITEAAREAEYSEATIHNARRDILERPNAMSVIEQFRISAHKALGDEYVLTKIQEQMEAKKWVNSYTEPDKYVEDWDARDKGIKNALKVRGLDEPVSQQNNIQVNFSQVMDKYKKE